MRPLTTVLLLATLVDCQCARDRERDAPAAGEETLSPLEASPPVLPLPVSGFGDAVVAVPAGATRPTPILVAVLGIGDSPEEQCAAWREIVGASAFILCPRGAKNMVQDLPEAGEDDTEPPEAGPPHQVGFFPPDLGTLDREVNAGLAALRARYGAHVSHRDTIYAGFSRGAFLGASLAMKYPERFQRLILIEGGQSPWEPRGASAFATGGGKRVLFACGQQECVDDADSAAKTLGAHKIDTRIVHGVGAGHSYKKQVQSELRRSFAWVIEDAPTWRVR